MSGDRDTFLEGRFALSSKFTQISLNNLYFDVFFQFFSDFNKIGVNFDEWSQIIEEYYRVKCSFAVYSTSVCLLEVYVWVRVRFFCGGVLVWGSLCVQDLTVSAADSFALLDQLQALGRPSGHFGDFAGRFLGRCWRSDGCCPANLFGVTGGQILYPPAGGSGAERKTTAKKRVQFGTKSGEKLPRNGRGCRRR